ncbi:hypothetical protein PFISCL1PPCAC_18043, partial [Pristionchus fissidentatus]
SLRIPEMRKPYTPQYTKRICSVRNVAPMLGDCHIGTIASVFNSVMQRRTSDGLLVEFATIQDCNKFCMIFDRFEHYRNVLSIIV